MRRYEKLLSGHPAEPDLRELRMDSMSVSEKVEGLDAFCKALRDLPQNIAKNVLRGAVNAGATVICQEAVRRAPEYHGDVSKGHPPPGTLKAAIRQKHVSEQSSVTRQVFY